MGIIRGMHTGNHMYPTQRKNKYFESKHTTRFTLEKRMTGTLKVKTPQNVNGQIKIFVQLLLGLRGRTRVRPDVRHGPDRRSLRLPRLPGLVR